MKASWTNDLDADVAKEIKGDFLSAHLVRKRLVKLLKNKIEEMELASTLSDYDITNWAYKQADYIGYKRALNFVINLIEE